MIKITLILLLFLNVNKLMAQYTYRGRVFKGLTGEHLRFGDVYIPANAARERARGIKVAKLDSLGYFTVTLNDSANVRLGIDCSSEGYAYKTVSHRDTLIIFTISVPCDDFNAEKAKLDIKENKLRLLFNGTINDFPKSEADQAFEKKYNIEYVNFLDTPEWSDCIRLYNGEIGHYLDEKFGKSWRNEVRFGMEFY